MSGQVIGSEFLPCTMADVEHIDLLLFLKNPEDYPVDMRLVAVKQMPELTVFWRYRATIGAIPQSTNGVFETSIPRESSL
jgi:hypothetical protein